MLGMVLKQQKWHCRYVEEYLAVGEAPEQVRNCFQQRSRWCKVGWLFNSLAQYAINMRKQALACKEALA